VPDSHKVAERTTAIVLARGQGARLNPLTRKICKPALPPGGTFRCIDFALSNCVNSGVRTLGVATQYEPDDLLATWICSGRPRSSRRTIRAGR
jgi:glucose-1-phosphate adenylyltransferase